MSEWKKPEFVEIRMDAEINCYSSALADDPRARVLKRPLIRDEDRKPAGILTRQSVRVHILGSAAGGGFPQWNCNCINCNGVRTGSLGAKPRTQCSVAVSADGSRWTLLNASPNLRTQICHFQTTAGA